MKILAIETAHGVCSVTLASQQNIISKRTDDEPSRQAERLFLTIEQMLKEVDLSYSDVNAVAANVGPGSFTGIRIGLAAARGIALAAKIPIIGVDGFEALEFSLKTEGDLFNNVLVVFDAKRGQVFAKLFVEGKGGDAFLLGYNEITRLVNVEGFLHVIGDGAELVEPFLPINSTSYAICREAKRPDATMVAKVALEKITQGIYAPASPVYIRPPDAKLPANKLS